MLASRIAGVPRGILIVGCVVLAALPLTGCGVPPELRATPSPAATRIVPGASGPSTVGPTSAIPTPATPTAPTTPDAAASATAVACAGRPASSEIIVLLRRARGLLPDGIRVTVTTGPMCAADWQYTVVEAAGHEPLQAVSRGLPGALTLVTAGTDVCAIPVRTAAPPPIRTLACDGPAGESSPA